MVSSRMLPSVIPLLGMLLYESSVSAHRDDYIDETFVYQTVEKGEFELEAWAEVHHPSTGSNAAWFTGAIEYGLNSRWMADMSLQWTHGEAPTSLGRLRVESRYRFSEEGRKFLDTAVSAEYEQLRLGPGLFAREWTARLILSKDIIPKLNTTLNLDFPYEVSMGELEFSYALGVRYPAESPFRIGSELRHFPSDHAATLFPQLWIVPREWLAIKLGAAFGLTDQSEPWLARLALETEI